MTYPKLRAALDDLLAKQIEKWGEDAFEFAINTMMREGEPVVEKKVAIPVTKEEVLDGH